MPLWNPPPLEKLALHEPHHAAATYCTPPIVTPSSAVTSAAGLAPVALRTSKMLVQLVVPAMPFSEFHTIAPPASRWFEFVRSIAMGAMKRGSGSFGTMKFQFLPPSVDFKAVRPVYSVITLFELVGSTSV